MEPVSLSFILSLRKRHCTRKSVANCLVISGNNRPKTFTRLCQANMICPGPSEIYPAPFLSLTKHARKFKKRKKRKKNGEKKRALRKTRIYNYYVPTKRSRCKAQVTPHCGEARWRRCGSARHRFTAQNFGIRTLDAARDCRIPTSDLFRWLKAQSNSTASS